MDKYNLRQIILDYPRQLDLGQKFAKGVTVAKKDFKNLVICGMGGSALPADLLASYLANQEESFGLPVYISRDYALPAGTDENSLVFISSYSGNTEETISCFHHALKVKTSIVAFSERGAVEKMAKENQVPHVKYSIDFPHFQPRYANTYAFAAMHQVLTNLELTDSIARFPKIDSSKSEDYGKRLAKKAKNKIPIVYASNRFKVIARNWKIKINENAKSPAFWNYFPELNHNEMLGFSLPKNEYFVFMLRDKEDHPRTRERMELTSEIYRKKGLETALIDIEGENYLEKSLRSLVLGDWVSYYLAQEYEQDPTPVDLVEEFKKKLS
ncbi:MAG: bifunctional phosphoglucose/phosphomannose isomerase [Candidatus Moranbacteria bacterium]|nr:bifunctional phosphoglucose/phosphomannose isomerase [Candidatus Moranbacteria bacterium]